jgi:hypothetical protein
MYSAGAFVSQSRELLALEVHPIRRYPDRHAWLEAAQRWQASIVYSLFDPDPF